MNRILPLILTAAVSLVASQASAQGAATWGGVGLIAAGAAVAVTGKDCRVVGEFNSYETSFGFLGSINLTGTAPVLDSDCRMTDFTITGSVGGDPLSRPASEYDVNATQRQIKRQIETGVSGESFRKPAHVYAGIGMMAGGAVIALLFRGSPAAENLQIGYMPGGARVGASFGF